MVITMNSYYETLGLIYECYDEGYISEDTKDTLKEKLKEARDKAEEKLDKAKEFAKKHKKELAAAGLGATALSGGAVVANNKLNKDKENYHRNRTNMFGNLYIAGMNDIHEIDKEFDKYKGDADKVNRVRKSMMRTRRTLDKVYQDPWFQRQNVIKN